MKFFQLPNSHSCAKVSIILNEKKIEVSEPAFDLSFLKSQDFLEKNPWGKVPCLADSNLNLFESDSIAEYLEEAYPQPSMMPSDIKKRAFCRMLSRIHDMYVSPNIANVFVPLLFNGKIGEKNLEDVEGLTNLEKTFEEFQKVEKLVDPKPYFMGKQFTIADASFALSFWYFEYCCNQYNKKEFLSKLPKLKTWFREVENRPSVENVIEQCMAANGIGSIDSIAA